MIADGDTTMGLIADPTDPGGQLAFFGDPTDLATVSLPAGAVQLDLIGDFFAGNVTPFGTINLDAAAGSSTLVVARGLVGNEPAFELLALEGGATADPENARVRVVHAARGLDIVFPGCNCATGDLEIYIDITGTTPLTTAPIGLSYESFATDYVTVPAASYTISATEAGSPDNVRIQLNDVNLAGGSVTTLVVKDQPGGQLGVEARVVSVNDLATQ